MATASEIQTTSLAYAQDTVDEFNSFIEALQAVAEVQTEVEVVDPSLVLVPDAFLNSSLAVLTSGQAAAPTLASFDAITAPDAPEDATFTEPTLVNIPDFSLVEPTITIPDAPLVNMPAAPGDAPEIATPALPSAPVFSLPEVPTFTPIVIPDVPALQLPTFSSTMPVDDIVAPSVVFDWNEAEYDSILLDEVKAKLLADILDGGYGIDTSDEAMIWERARERELRNVDAALQEVSRRHAALGHMLPPGALFAQQDAARDAGLSASSTLSRETAIKRADQFVENRRFTIEQAVGLERVLMDFYGSVAERALNAAKAQVEMGIALFNAAVARYNVKLETHKVAADVFETQVRAALAVLEGYKTQVEAARLESDIQRNYAELYNTQLGGVKILIDMYRTQMEAAQVQAEIEKLKLESFRTAVDSYTAQVGARTAEFQMFESRIKGETAKIVAFRESINAYGARVEAYKTRTEAEESVSRVQIAQAESRLSAYRTDIERYRADVTKVAESIRGAVSKYGAQVQAYSAYSNAVSKGYDLALETQRANASIHAEASRQAIQSANNRLSALLKITDQRIGAASSGAQALAAVASSATNAVVGIASITE